MEDKQKQDNENRMNIYIDPELKKRLKHFAVDEGKSASEIIEQALLKFLPEENK
jgi:predicted transcriptional regulator